MTVQLFSLRGVPDDEAEEIRELLTASGVDYYETPAGNWGISMPALWLNDESQLPRAKSLINEYQEQRLVKAREDYAQLQREGKGKTLITRIKEKPATFFIYLAIIALILYLSIKPFITLGQ